MTFDPKKYVIEVEKKESAFGRVKTWNYAAKLVHIIDLWSKTKEWEDSKTKEKYEYETKQIFVNFALSAKLLQWDDAVESEDKKEVTIWKVYSLSISNSSNLYKDVKAWFWIEPKDKFNPFELIGKDVMVNVWEHKSWDKTYGVIESLSQMPDGMTVYKLDEIKLDWSILEEGLYNADLEKFLFGFAKKDLEASKEYIALTGKEPKKSIEEEDKEIAEEIAKSKEAQKTTDEVSADEAEEIFEKKEDKDMK